MLTWLGELIASTTSRWDSTLSALGQQEGVLGVWMGLEYRVGKEKQAQVRGSAGQILHRCMGHHEALAFPSE